MLINNDLVNHSRLSGIYQPPGAIPAARERNVPASSEEESPAYIVSLSGQAPEGAAGKTGRAARPGEGQEENPQNAGKAGQDKKNDVPQDAWRRGKSDAEQESVEQEIRNLKRRENEVIAHENAHKAVGGQYAGGINYERSSGPDGRQYITGGGVSIDIGGEATPEQTIAKMQVVRRAALAPADPSPQDKSVAASASAQEASARQQLNKQSLEKATKEPADKVNTFKDSKARAQEPAKGGSVDLSA